MWALLTASGGKHLVKYHRDVRPKFPAGDCVLEPDGNTVRNYWRMQEHSAFFRELAAATALRTLVARLAHSEPVLVAVELFTN